MSADSEPTSGPQAQPEMDARARSDRRQRERRVSDLPVSVERRGGVDRRQKQRRRARSMNQYDMDEDVLEFVKAIGRFKERSGRPFPTWSEVLGILRELGYEKSP